MVKLFKNILIQGNPWSGNNPPPWTPPGGSQCSPPPCIPINENIIILIIAGVILAYLIFKNKQS